MSDPLVDGFWSRYKAYFTNLPFKPDEAAVKEVWYKMIRRVPASRLDDLFATVVKERGGARWKPGVADFHKALDIILGPTPLRSFREDCGLCNNAGFMTVLAYMDAKKKLHLGVGPNCKRWTTPCLCSRGKKYAPEGTEEGRQKVKEWLVGFREEVREAETDEHTYMNFIIAENQTHYWDGRNLVGKEQPANA